MGLEGGTSRYDDIENSDNKMDEPLLDKSELVGRGYQIQPDTVVSLPSSQDGTTVFGYNVGTRPYQDLAFSIIFLLLILISASFGIYGVVHSNSEEYQFTDTAHYDRDHQTCSISNLASSPSLPLHVRVITRVASSTSKPLWISLITTLALSGPLAFGVLHLLRVYTKELVYATLPFLVLLPIALNLTWFILCQRNIECRTEFDSSGQYALFGIILLMCGVMMYVIYANWEKIELTIRVVKTASEALHQNLALLIALPSLSVLLALFCVPFLVFMGYAYTNGKLVVNPELVDHPTKQCARGTDTPCCVWEPAAWVMYYEYLSGFAILWSAMIIAQIQVLVISGAVSQWYFAQAGSSTVNATRRALSVAFGPSFGTACLAGLVVAFVRVVRGALNKADNERGQEGALAVFVRACLQWILEAVEFFTRFTSNFAAITGESFYSSAVMTYNLLKRNLLSTVLVEVISDKLLGMVTVVLSFAYALLVYGVLSLSTDLTRDQRLITAILSWLIVITVLILFVRVLSNIVDTVYICYAMDKDQGVASKPEIHNVLAELPGDNNPALAVRRDV